MPHHPAANHPGLCGRRMKMREQLSNSEIAKRTGLSRNTVKKWLKAPGDEIPKYRRQSGFTKLTLTNSISHFQPGHSLEWHQTQRFYSCSP
jgi:transcriptional regulator with XRE-family HTH domain